MATSTNSSLNGMVELANVSLLGVVVWFKMKKPKFSLHKYGNLNKNINSVFVNSTLLKRL